MPERDIFFLSYIDRSIKGEAFTALEKVGESLAGDTVELKDKVLLINGKTAPEPYVVHKKKEIIPATENPRDNLPPLKIAADSYFVMGDNRDRSFDSRFWGTVSKDKIKGTVKSIYWSWDKTTMSVRWDRIGKAVQ